MHIPGDSGLHIGIFPDVVSCARGLEAERYALHEEIELKCFYEGSSVLIVGERKFKVKAGEIVVINPYEFHATVDSGTGEDLGKYHSFMIPLDVFSDHGVDGFNFRTLLLGNHAVFRTVFSENRRMYNILMQVVKESKEKKKAYHMAITGMMMEFFSILLREGICEDETGSMKSRNLRSYKLLEPAIRHIRDNFRNEITIEELAEMCHVTKQYFCRAFKALTGKTAMEYLREYRLKIADVLLSNSDKKIASIAEECGFETASYFCRSYKNRYGFAPSCRRKI